MAERGGAMTCWPHFPISPSRPPGPGTTRELPPAIGHGSHFAKFQSRRKVAGRGMTGEVDLPDRPPTGGILADRARAVNLVGSGIPVVKAGTVTPPVAEANFVAGKIGP
jgi:hypothetical protein